MPALPVTVQYENKQGTKLGQPIGIILATKYCSNDFCS